MADNTSTSDQRRDGTTRDIPFSEAEGGSHAYRSRLQFSLANNVVLAGGVLVALITCVLLAAAYGERERSRARNLSTPDVSIGEVSLPAIDPLQKNILQAMAAREWRWSSQALANDQASATSLPAPGAPSNKRSVDDQLLELDDSQLLSDGKALAAGLVALRQTQRAPSLGGTLRYVENRFLKSLRAEIAHSACGPAKQLADRAYFVLQSAAVPSSLPHDRPEQVTTVNKVLLLHALFETPSVCVRDPVLFRGLGEFILSPQPLPSPELLTRLSSHDDPGIRAWFLYLEGVRLLRAKEFDAAAGQFQQVVATSSGKALSELAALGRVRSLFWGYRSELENRTSPAPASVQLANWTHALQAAALPIQTASLQKSVQDYIALISTQVAATSSLLQESERPAE